MTLTDAERERRPVTPALAALYARRRNGRLARGKRAQELWDSGLKWREVGPLIGLSLHRACRFAKMYLRSLKSK